MIDTQHTKTEQVVFACPFIYPSNMYPRRVPLFHVYCLTYSFSPYFISFISHVYTSRVYPVPVFSSRVSFTCESHLVQATTSSEEKVPFSV